MIKKGALFLVLVLVGSRVSSDTVRGDGKGQGDATPLIAIAYTAPAVALNTVPGFGLGSYAQGDVRRGVRLSVVDGVGAGLIGVGLYGIARYPDPDEGGIAALSLLAGYGVVVVGKTLGVVGPIIHVRQEGVDASALFPPIVYNTVPGFGLGSALQGDADGATMIALFDGIALVSVGVLSFSALAGIEILSGVAGVTTIGAYLTARVLGIIRPVRYRNQDEVGFASFP